MSNPYFPNRSFEQVRETVIQHTAAYLVAHGQNPANCNGQAVEGLLASKLPDFTPEMLEFANVAPSRQFGYLKSDWTAWLARNGGAPMATPIAKEVGEAPAPRPAPAPQAAPPKPAGTPLTSVAVGRFNKLMTSRGDTVMEALEEVGSTGTEKIMAGFLEERGHPIGSYDLRQNLRDLEGQKEDVDRYVERDEQLKVIALEVAAVTRKIDAEIEAKRTALTVEVDRLRAEFELERAQIQASRESREKEQKARKKARIEEIFAARRPGLLEEINGMKGELEEVRKLERELAQAAQRRATAIESSRGRLIFLVRDFVSKAQTRLMTAKTLEEAEALVASIPDAAQIISMAEDPERGVQALVASFAPSAVFQIEGPKKREEEAPEPEPAVKGKPAGRIITPDVIQEDLDIADEDENGDDDEDDEDLR